MNSAPLFACSHCFSRHPYEDLSQDYQLCKECRGAFPIVKCTYCRSEFQQNGKGSNSNTCTSCEQNIKAYGKPRSCEYCSINAAFIGTKCNRCTKSEIKYGPPVNCDQCKQKCAFNKQDERKKAGGKLLCWLCTLSYKRALAKTKTADAENISYIKVSSHKSKNKETKRNHKRHRSDSTTLQVPNAPANGPSNKMSRNNSAPPPPSPSPVQGKIDFDPHSSDHIIAMTQLKEQIASLKKQVTLKDAQLLSKDKLITELKAQHFTNETELRNKILQNEREHEDKIDYLNKRIASLLKEVAGLSKNVKRSIREKPSASIFENNASNGSSGSGVDSPAVPDSSETN